MSRAATRKGHRGRRHVETMFMPQTIVSTPTTAVVRLDRRDVAAGNVLAAVASHVSDADAAIALRELADLLEAGQGPEAA